MPYPGWSISELVNLHVFLEDLREMNPEVDWVENNKKIVISDRPSLYIDDIVITKVPVTIGNLTNLERLSLYAKEIPKEIGTPKIIYIYFYIFIYYIE